MAIGRIARNDRMGMFTTNRLYGEIAPDCMPFGWCENAIAGLNAEAGAIGRFCWQIKWELPGKSTYYRSIPR